MTQDRERAGNRWAAAGRWAATATIASGALVAIWLGGSCAEPHLECRLNSDCARPGRCLENRCVWDCRANVDCPGGWCDELGRCQTGPQPDADADVEAEADTRIDGDADVDGRTDADADVPAEAEAEAGADADADAEAEAEAGADADGVYLDPCAAPVDCAERLCLADAFWGDGHCTRECTAGDPSSCATEHYCALYSGGVSICAEAHMGLPCNPADPTANACAYGCIGVAGGGAHCTRPCTSAADCPGGYACGLVTPTVPADGKVCVLINLPCPLGNECPSGIGACGGTGSWCSAACQTVADCPRVGAGIPAYDCLEDSGVGYFVCQPSDAMLALIGENALGTSCAAGTDCRSGMCGTDDTGGAPYCLEPCTVRGLCPHNFGCVPFRTASGPYHLYCVFAGNGELGAPCTNNLDCRSAYCDASHCTRICNDGFCPTGMTCTSSGITADSVAIRVCR